MTQGLPAGQIGPTAGAYDAPPDDTGEAIGLPPAGLTITFGFGPGAVPRRRRQGPVRARRPAARRRCATCRTSRPTTSTRPGRDGDLCVQACADDPQVAVHAIRNLARIGFGTVAVRWSQLGFGRTSTTSTVQSTPRNLFGFKDGTLNVKAEEPDDLDEHVWVGRGRRPEGRLAGRRLLPGGPADQHDHRDLGPAGAAASRRRSIGRTKAAGAPLSGGSEFSRARLRRCRARRRAADPDATPTSGSCTRTSNDGVRMLRRGYNFVDGTNALGRPRRRPVLHRLRPRPAHPLHPDPDQDGARRRAEGVPPATGSGALRRPAGHRPGEYVGQALFA